jgi:acetoin utilization deacetylase AcuC-like enzyme
MDYRRALSKALNEIIKFNPIHLVVALGLDIAKGDPTGTWLLSAEDFTKNGKMISSSGFPTVVIQEGGYQNKVLGTNAQHFFKGLWEGYYKK